MKIKNRKLIGLVAVMMVFAMMALGSGSSDSSSSSSNNSSNSEQSGAEVSSKGDKNEESKKNDIVFEELIAVDNDECKIVLNGIKEDGIWGYTLKANLENKSAEKTYMFSVESAAVNGVSLDPFFATEVAAGKKSNSDISFSNSKMKEYEIGDITDIEISFKVYDSDDWMAEPVARETVHVYPLGEEKATKFERATKDTDVVLVDNDKVKVVYIGTTNDSIWGYTVNLYLENKTDSSTMFSCDEASVNGYMADPFWATSVGAGKMGFGSMSWSTSTLEENGISTVEEIEFKLNAYNDDDYSANKYVEEIFTIKP